VFERVVFEGGGGVTGGRGRDWRYKI
jgi:hypothetical protein